MQRLKTRSQRSVSRSTSRSVPLIEGMETRRMFSTYIVTTTADSGAGSLRDAIKAANKVSDADTIKFAIGSGAKTITTLTALPYIQYPVTIDGTTQPGYAGKPLVELNGSTSGGYGLNIGAGSSTVKGMAINKYSAAILFTKKGNNVVQGNYIGLGLDGETGKGNTDKGIIVQTDHNLIKGNVISGNATTGLQLYTYTSAYNTVQGNFIGTNATGTKAVWNGGSGISVNGGTRNLIGGTVAGARNIISGNKADGIVINKAGATYNVIQGNYVGTDVTGTKRIGNGNYGIETSQAYTQIGGPEAAARNIVSASGYAGITLWLASGSNCVVENNYVGTDVTGNYDIGNYQNGIEATNGASNSVIKNNLISGNDIDGVMLYQGSNNLVTGNTIGFNASRTKALNNFRHGIRFTNVVSGTATNNYIGNNNAYGMIRTGGGVVTLSANTLINEDVFGLTL